MTRRAKLAAVVALTAALALTGCATGGSPESDDNAGRKSDTLYERAIDLTDGRTVTCVVYRWGYAGGVSCDWAGASE